MLFTIKKNSFNIFNAYFYWINRIFFIGLFFLYNQNYKRAKIFLTISFLWIAVIGYSPFSNYLIQPLENQYKSYLKIDSTINYVLVLGSHMFQMMKCLNFRIFQKLHLCV